MQTIAPLTLAAPWDNVGVLIEAPIPRPNSTTVFLTIDLTLEVLHEALQDPTVGVIMAYHPPLFKSFKTLRMTNEKEKIAMLCCAHGISVYSPHTALDACEGGINDWLLSGLGAGSVSVSLTGAKMIELDERVDFNSISDRIKSHLGLSHLRRSDSKRPIKTIAVCAGSGIY